MYALHNCNTYIHHDCKVWHMVSQYSGSCCSCAAESEKALSTVGMLNNKQQESKGTETYRWACQLITASQAHCGAVHVELTRL